MNKDWTLQSRLKEAVTNVVEPFWEPFDRRNEDGFIWDFRSAAGMVEGIRIKK